MPNDGSKNSSSTVGSSSKMLGKLQTIFKKMGSSRNQKQERKIKVEEDKKKLLKIEEEQKKLKEELKKEEKKLKGEKTRLKKELKEEEKKLKEEEKKTLELEKKQDNEIINFFNTTINNADQLKSVFQPLLDVLNTQVNTQISVISEPSAPARSPVLARQPAPTRPSALARPSEDTSSFKKQVIVKNQIEKCYNKYIRTLASCITTQGSYSTDKNITIKLDNELTIIYSLMFITLKKKIVLTDFRSFIESINAILSEYDRLIGDSNSTIGKLADSSMIADEKKVKLTEITKKTKEYLKYYKSLNEKNIYSDLQIARNLLHRLQAIILIIITPDAKSKCNAHIATPNKGGGKTRKMINNSVKSKR